MRRRNSTIILLVFLALLLVSNFRSGNFSNPLEWFLNLLITIPGIIVALSFHEYAHAIVAYKLGDNTPKFQGRVTINPMAHIDWFGFIALCFCGFGWGKPVEINPYNFRKRRSGELMVALAGVVMNLILAFVFAGILKIIVSTIGPATEATGFNYYLQLMIFYTVQINLVLMIFNLIPIPPLDGFDVVIEIFNLHNTNFYRNAYAYGQWLLLLLLLFGFVGKILSPAVSAIMNGIFAIFGM